MSGKEEKKDSASTASNADQSTTTDNSAESKHDSKGAADLEKVTDFAEEKEILSGSTTAAADLESAIANIRTRQLAAAQEKAARERELAKVAIKKEDVDLIAEEMELPKSKAERTLREHKGNVTDALIALTN